MKRLTIVFLKFYVKYVSPIFRYLFEPGCRFYPTCSRYAIGVIERFGMKRGLVLTFKRISKCHPFDKASFFDPVPKII